jgi:hypothetical protein
MTRLEQKNTLYLLTMEQPKNRGIKKFVFLSLTKFTTLHFFATYEWANKLEYYITAGWKSLPVTNNQAYWANL